MKQIKSHSLVSAFVAMLFTSFSVFAAVQAPPLPVGSANVNIVAGQSPFEQERMQRAHKHHSPAHYKKDMTRDDTIGAESTSRRYGSDADNTTKSVK
jgi:hypothetical protein